MFEKVYKQLKINFIAALTITLFHVFLGWFMAKNLEYSGLGDYAVALKTVIILFVLISIPLTLKLFSLKLKKLTTLSDPQQQAKRYIQASRLRVLVILIGLISAIMFYFLEGMQDMLYVVAIEVAVLVLCIPTKKRVQSEIDVFTNQNEEE